MALTKYTKDTAVIENVGTKPEDRTTLNDLTFKQKWDENATDWKTFYNDTVSEELDALITAIKGVGWTSESLKGLADLISTHKADLITDSDGVHGLKIESGVFTPYFYGATTAGTNTYATQVGKYTKVGNLVSFTIDLKMSAKDAAMAGEVYIGGLPFSAGTVPCGVPIAYYSNFTGLTGYGLCAYTYNTVIFIKSAGQNSTANIAPENYTNATWLRVSGVYMTA